MGKDYRFEREWGSRRKPKRTRAKMAKRGTGPRKKKSKDSLSHLKQQDIDEYEDPDQGFEKFHAHD